MKNGRDLESEDVLACRLDHVLDRLEDPRADRAVGNDEVLVPVDPPTQPVGVGTHDRHEVRVAERGQTLDVMELPLGKEQAGQHVLSDG